MRQRIQPKLGTLEFCVVKPVYVSPIPLLIQVAASESWEQRWWPCDLCGHPCERTEWNSLVLALVKLSAGCSEHLGHGLCWRDVILHFPSLSKPPLKVPPILVHSSVQVPGLCPVVASCWYTRLEAESDDSVAEFLPLIWETLGCQWNLVPFSTVVFWFVFFINKLALNDITFNGTVWKEIPASYW